MADFRAESSDAQNPALPTEQFGLSPTFLLLGRPRVSMTPHSQVEVPLCNPSLGLWAWEHE